MTKKQILEKLKQLENQLGELANMIYTIQRAIEEDLKDE